MYSDGALIPSGITVSPRLDVGISRLEFYLQNKITDQYIEGSSRATEIAWSLFGEKPFLEISIGPSVVKDLATAESLKFYTPSFKTIDWQNIFVVANIESVVAKPFAEIRSVTLDGNVNIESAKVSNVHILAEEFSATDGKSSYTASLIKSDHGELNLNNNLVEQLLSRIFKIEDIIISEPNFTTPQATMEVSITKKDKNLKIDLHDVMLSEFSGHMQHLKVDASFTQSNVLRELKIVSVDGFFSKKLPKLHEISASLRRLGHEQYGVSIEGDFEEFELFDSDNFIGLLPAGNFVIDLEIDSATSKITSTSKINFTTLDSTDIFGFLDLEFSSELLRNLECAFLDCELTNLNLLYQINIDDEWLKGSAYCVKSICDLSEMDYLIRTSNTANIFTILNQANILSPLSSLYLFSAISSGRKINGGHEFSFQF